MIFKEAYECIGCRYGFFILEGSPFNKYIKDLMNNNANNKSDMIYSIVKVVCRFTESLFSTNYNNEKDNNWENMFEEFVSSKYTREIFQRIKPIINIEDLVKACKSSSFTMYDRRLSYRYYY